MTNFIKNTKILSSTDVSKDSEIKIDLIRLKEHQDFHALENLNKYKEAKKLAREHQKLADEARSNIITFQQNYVDSYKFGIEDIQSFLPEELLKDFKFAPHSREYKTWKDVRIEFYESWVNSSGDHIPILAMSEKFDSKFFVDHVNKIIVPIGAGVKQDITFNENENRIDIEYSTTYSTTDYSGGYRQHRQTKLVKWDIAKISIDIHTNQIIKNERSID